MRIINFQVNNLELTIKILLTRNNNRRIPKSLNRVGKILNSKIMKKLEKIEMKSINGGASITICDDLGNGLTGCVYTDGSKVCVGVYTHGGDTVGISCSS